MRYSIINRIALISIYTTIAILQSCNAKQTGLSIHSPVYDKTVKETDGKTFDLSYGGWNKYGVPLFYRSNAYFYVYTNGQPISFRVREQ